MLRLVGFLLLCFAAVVGLSWLADRPGSIIVNWEGYRVDVTVFRAIVGLGVLLLLSLIGWSIFRTIWHSPAAVGEFFKRRRQARGLDALSSGMIAIGSGDRENATRYAIQARKALPNEPLTHLLRAQAAQLTDDRATSRRIYEGMLGSPDTEALGLRGLFLEASGEGESEAARQFAERAVRLNAKLGWASGALFDLQCKQRNWAGALETLAGARKNAIVEKSVADRRRAVLLTAQAQIAEDADPDKALSLASEAHGLAPNLVPAADIAGRLLASKGSTAKAAKILQRTWKRSPHPDLALTYAFARPGDSPHDRLERVKALALITPHTIEAPIALATAAIEAREWDEARKALEPLLEHRLTQRVCTLMARIEGRQHGDAGRVREWLARAVNAPSDPVWTADGVTSDHWAPVSPVSGELDAFEWRVPVESVDKQDGALLSQQLEEFIALGVDKETVIDTPVEVVTEAIRPAQPAGTPPGEPAAAAAAAPAPAPAPAAAAVASRPDEGAAAQAAKAAAATAVAAGVQGKRDAAGAVAEPLMDGEVAGAAEAGTSRPASQEASQGHPGETNGIKEKGTPSGSGKASRDTDGDPDGAADKRPAPKSAPKAAQAGKDKAAPEAAIFVSPPAPDDPGTDNRDMDPGRSSPLTRFRAGRAKNPA